MMIGNERKHIFFGDKRKYQWLCLMRNYDRMKEQAARLMAHPETSPTQLKEAREALVDITQKLNTAYNRMVGAGYSVRQPNPEVDY